MFSFELVTPPASEPVSLAEAKSWSRITSAGNDSDISLMIQTAREKCENLTNRRFITQTWRMWLDSWPRKSGTPWWDGKREGSIVDVFGYAQEIDLKLCPVIAVSSLSYFLTDDTEVVLDPSVYQVVDGKGGPGKVVLRYGQIWPTTILRLARGVKIDFSVGYGASGSAVPESIKSAIKALTAHLFEHRGDEEAQAIPKVVKDLLNPFTTMRA